MRLRRKSRINDPHIREQKAPGHMTNLVGICHGPMSTKSSSWESDMGKKMVKLLILKSEKKNDSTVKNRLNVGTSSMKKMTLVLNFIEFFLT